MTDAGEKLTPAVAEAGGWVRITRLATAAGLTLNVLLRALLRPLALALSCLLVPAASMRRSLKATTPLPALLPISRLVVPCNGPVPLLRLRVTLKLAANPTALSLPN